MGTLIHLPLRGNLSDVGQFIFNLNSGLTMFSGLLDEVAPQTEISARTKALVTEFESIIREIIVSDENATGKDAS